MRESDEKQMEQLSVREHVRVRLLGPMSMSQRDTPVPLPGGRQRSLFASLLLNSGQVVTHDRLVELVWDDRPPADHRAALRTCTMRLRKALAPVWRNRLDTHPSGYMLHVKPGELDWQLFQSGQHRAAAVCESKDWSTALQELDDALALWRGHALMDIPSQRLRDEHQGYLEEAYARAVEWRYEALMALGRHQKVTGEIHRFIGRFPLRENLRAQLMLALYRSHRDAEALAAYEKARTLLADELGIDPSERLRELHRKILVRDPSLDPPSSPSVPAFPHPAPEAPLTADPAPAPPRLGSGHLPLPARGFVGRAAELNWLDEILKTFEVDAASAGGAHQLVLITGAGGIGKTGLITRWAHTVADRFPDGQYFVDLRGFDPTLPALSCHEALGELLAMLHVPYERVPHTVTEQLRMYRGLMAGRRVLLILDNAADAGQVRDLLPHSTSALVLVSSRNQLPGLVVSERADVLPLRPMTHDDTLAMLEYMLAKERTHEEQDAITRLLKLCDGIPLTTCIVGAQAALTPELSLTNLCDRLESIPNVLDRFEVGDPSSSIRRMLEGSYMQLSETAAHAYRSLGVHRGSPASLGSLAAMTESSLPGTRKVLNELVRNNLVTISAGGLYRMHDFIRAHAVEMAHATVPAEERVAGRQRLFTYLLRCAFEAASQIDPFGPCTALPLHGEQAADTGTGRLSPEGPHWEQPGESTTSAQAAVWFSTHLHVLVSMLKNCQEDGTTDRAWMLLECISVLLSREGRWKDLAAAARQLLEAMRAHAPTQHADPAEPSAFGSGHEYPDRRGLASVRLQLGLALARLDDPSSLRHITTAHALFHEQGADSGRARSYLALTHYHGRRKEAAPLQRYAAQAAHAFRNGGDRNGYAESLNCLGWYSLGLGEVETSIAACNVALRVFQEEGNTYGEADTWDSLAHGHELRGDVELSLSCYENAIILDRQLDRCGHRINQADTLLRYGDLSASSGRPDQALRAWSDAAELLAGIAHPLAEQVHSRLCPASPGRQDQNCPLDAAAAHL